MPGGLRRPPTIARRAAVISSGLRWSLPPMRNVNALKRKPDRSSSNDSRPQFVDDWVTWAAACRTVHPGHKDGVSHCSGVRVSRKSASSARCSSEITKVEAEWRAHLGLKAYDELRAALVSLREPTDPYR